VNTVVNILEQLGDCPHRENCFTELLACMVMLRADAAVCMLQVRRRRNWYTDLSIIPKAGVII
jgi:hypothetical protein